MDVVGFFQALTDKPQWRIYCIGANATERVTRAVQYLTLGILATAPPGARLPLLPRGMTTRELLLWCSRCRQVACPLLALRDYCESLGGKRFEGPSCADRLSDGCALGASLVEPWMLAAELRWITLGCLQKRMEQFAFWAGAGEPFFGLLGQLSRWSTTPTSNGVCLIAAKGCETLFRLTAEDEAWATILPPLGVFSGALSMAQVVMES